MKLSNTYIGHIFLLIANVIYGFNYVIAKGIMGNLLSPYAVVMCRVFVAALVFNIIALFVEKQKVPKKDLLRLFFCSLFGVSLNQIMFFSGLDLTTSINASIIMVMCPLMTLIFAYFIIKEKLSVIKVLGIFVGLAGSLLLILNYGETKFDSNTIEGNLRVFVNASSFALYLVLVKPLMVKYNPFIIMKWVFIFGAITVAPFCYPYFAETDWSVLTTNNWMSLFYIVVMTTVVAYFLYVSSLKSLTPTVVSTYIYLQPVLASAVAIIYLGEELTPTKILSALVIFFGVYLTGMQVKRLKWLTR